eukprot:COSAG03_NODE_705_length_6186_cov_3.663217_6_plen_103_part_00
MRRARRLPSRAYLPTLPHFPLSPSRSVSLSLSLALPNALPNAALQEARLLRGAGESSAYQLLVWHRQPFLQSQQSGTRHQRPEAERRYDGTALAQGTRRTWE